MSKHPADPKIRALHAREWRDWRRQNASGARRAWAHLRRYRGGPPLGSALHGAWHPTGALESR